MPCYRAHIDINMINTEFLNNIIHSCFIRIKKCQVHAVTYRAGINDTMVITFFYELAQVLTRNIVNGRSVRKNRVC